MEELKNTKVGIKERNEVIKHLRNNVITHETTNLQGIYLHSYLYYI